MATAFSSRGTGLSFQGVPLSGVGTGGRSTTSTTADPFQRFLANFILNQVQSPQAQVPGFTTEALQKITQQPSVTPENFESIAGPLRESLRPGEQRETRDLTDLFRKAGAGSLQSGAFASSARRLVGDQASRRNQLLAANYIPLTQQLSSNTLNAIRLGLGLPEAQTGALKFPTTLAASLAPLSQTSESIGVSPAPGVGGSGTTSSPTQPKQSLTDLLTLQAAIGGKTFSPGYGDYIPGFGFGSFA